MADSATRYVALLRAINLTAQSWRMADLRRSVEAAGFRNVSTYIQTGNVIFDSPLADPDKLTKQLERQFATDLDYHGKVFVRTSAELRRAAKANPFRPQPGQDLHSHLVFLDAAPDTAHRRALTELDADEYQLAVKGQVLYYAYAGESAGRNRRNIDFERILGVRGTARTWRVVDKLIELAG